MKPLGVEQSWALMHETLERCDPERLANLRPPAAPSAITALEQALGLALPEDLRASLLTHDGEYGQRPGVLPGAWELSGTEAIADNQAFLRQWSGSENGEEQQDTFLDASEFFSRVKKVIYDPAWLPVADNSGHHLCIDLAPETRGRSGQVIRWVKASGPERIVAASFGNYLSGIARNLQRQYANRAAESGGRLGAVQVPIQPSGESA